MLVADKKTEFEHHTDDTVGFLTPEQITGSEYKNVRVLNPWMAYKFWRNGRAMTTDMFLCMAEWLEGQCRIYALLGYKYRATQYYNLLESIHELWQWSESGTLDGHAFMVLFEPMLKEIRPDVKVQPCRTESQRHWYLPREKDPKKRIYQSTIDVEVGGQSAKIKVVAMRQGNRPAKTMRIWQVLRVAQERSYYQSELLAPVVPFSSELTMQEAVEIAKRIAFEEA